MFLSVSLESGEAGRSRSGTLLGEASCSREVSGGVSANYGAPFRAEALLWGRCHPRASGVGPPLVPLRDSSRFVMDLWARSFPGLAWNSVGLSPVSVVSRCTQARPPVTLSVRSTQPSYVLRGEESGLSSARLRQVRERGLPTRPKRDPSRATLAWPLRHRALLPDAGCVGPLLDFEQGFLNGYGPAQVGLGPPFGGLHRLRLNYHTRGSRLTRSQRRRRTGCFTSLIRLSARSYATT